MHDVTSVSFLQVYGYKIQVKALSPYYLSPLHTRRATALSSHFLSLSFLFSLSLSFSSMACINTFCDPVCLCLADLYTKFSFQETRSRSLSLCFSSPSLSFSLFLLSRSLTSGFKKLTFCASASASAAATTNSKATALHSIVIARSNNRDQT